MASFNQSPLGQTSIAVSVLPPPVIESSIHDAATLTSTLSTVSSGDGMFDVPIDGLYNQIYPRSRRNKGIISAESV